MKLFFAALAVLFLSATKNTKVEYTDNEHVKLTVIAPIKMNTGSSSTISFQLEPLIGIHINTNPMFEFVLDKNSNFEIAGKPQFDKNAKGYLDTVHPILFSVTTKKGTAPGKIILKGSLRYFFCSEKDGWCNRYAQPIEVSIEVTK
jgi:hypothetical protein